ncbi:MAG TPA: ABC transporter ATP-binding protein, partial [Thermoplasmata archaeon]|nr:ABC transporter ATP-binding protein [Thermoplasmata archaeon]
GLDVLMRRALLDSVRDEVRRGLTVVFTTHNLEEADYLCDRVAVIDEGRILVLDALENLKRLYGGKKVIELTVAGADAGRYFGRLAERIGSASLSAPGGSAVILADDAKAVLSAIVELAQEMGVQLEWLNVRKNTLEDVFLRSVGHGGEPNAAP